MANPAFSTNLFLARPVLDSGPALVDLLYRLDEMIRVPFPVRSRDFTPIWEESLRREAHPCNSRYLVVVWEAAEPRMPPWVAFHSKAI